MRSGHLQRSVEKYSQDMSELSSDVSYYDYTVYRREEGYHLSPTTVPDFEKWSLKYLEVK